MLRCLASINYNHGVGNDRERSKGGKVGDSLAKLNRKLTQSAMVALCSSILLLLPLLLPFLLLLFLPFYFQLLSTI